MKPVRLDAITHTESSFQSAIVDLAIVHGWHIHHALPAQIRPGIWRTHVMGNTGFPDLVLAHKDRGVIFAELKTIRGRVTNGQKSWLDTLKDGGAEVYVWRPEDWSYIKQRLAGLIR
jgi:hypothetical protein